MSAEPDRRARKPRNVAVAGRQLALAWGDGHESYFPFETLRRNCPCAVCRSQASKAAPAGPLRVVTGPDPGSLSIRALRPVGAYAVQVVWSDGHDSGIFSFETLRRACPCPDCSVLPDAGW